jgi:hypothetical protein
MRRISAGLVLAAFFFGGGTAWACPQCRPLVQAGVYNQDFAGTLFLLLVPVGVLVLIGAGLYFAAPLKARLRKERIKWLTSFNAAR